MLNVVKPRGSPEVDEFTRECLCIRVGRKLESSDVPDARASNEIEVLADLFIARGTPGFIRSDNGPEFVALAVKGWITGVGAKRAYIQPGSLRWHFTCDANGTFASSARGRTATWKASTASCGTSCSTWRCSTCSSKPAC